MIAKSTIDVMMPVEGAMLKGMLTVPRDAKGIVAFAHGSGSSRLSPRNQEVARALQDAGFGTLLFDLLTHDEGLVDERTREHRFNVPLLGERMTAAIDWLRTQTSTATLPIGLFGASTGAAAALVAAADQPDAVRAVVSRGGRPDLAGDALTRVVSPTLLIVGELDTVVIDMNQSARARLRGVSSMTIIEGASHLFDEQGTMEQVTHHATRWFETHLGN
jgi:putative phosphoribosyl transferase